VWGGQPLKKPGWYLTENGKITKRRAKKNAGGLHRDPMDGKEKGDHPLLGDSTTAGGRSFSTPGMNGKKKPR